jgi:succinate-semialdehyde dehydrogenase/glutarate-semialdehyde dehydrogenase
MAIITINPNNGKQIKEIAEDGLQAIERKLKIADAAFNAWSKSPIADRAEKLKKTAALLRERKAEFAELMALEMGKPLAQGAAEVEKSAWVCDYYAESAEAQLKDEIIETGHKKSFISYRPVGAILTIMPWNFPFWQVFRCAAPSIAAGNATVLKHAPNTAECSIAIEGIFRDAGFPEGIFTNILLSAEAVPEITALIIENDIIKGVTLTGSSQAGANVAAAAGRALKKTVLELGGSDPYLILDDADLEKAAEACISSRMANSGQTCIAAKRFIATEKIYGEFLELCLEKAKCFVPGDPLDTKYNMGPLARKDLLLKLHRQVSESIKKGAKAALGCFIPKNEGYYYPPSILTNVKKGMPAFDEEMFGPVASIIKAKNEADAVNIANDTQYGLGAAVFTADIEKGERIARDELVAGACAVNTIVKSDPRMPFGGTKNSGFGRELSVFGLREFVNIKSIVID